MVPYKLVFDEFILEQLKKLKENESVREILSTMFNKLEEQGVNAGKCIDLPLHLYEMKCKQPPIRLYFKQISEMEILLFEFELKTSEKKQNQTIGKLRHRIRIFFRSPGLHGYIFLFLCFFLRLTTVYREYYFEASLFPESSENISV